MAEKRFVKVYSQGGWSRIMEIWVDTQTGVNYVCTQSGHAGGMTPLLNRDGTPVVTSIPREEQ
jgi:hypothetical protein